MIKMSNCPHFSCDLQKIYGGMVKKGFQDNSLKTLIIRRKKTLE